MRVTLALSGRSMVDDLPLPAATNLGLDALKLDPRGMRGHVWVVPGAARLLVEDGEGNGIAAVALDSARDLAERSLASVIEGGDEVVIATVEARGGRVLRGGGG